MKTNSDKHYGPSPIDAEYLRMQMITREAIYRAFQVPEEYWDRPGDDWFLEDIEQQRKRGMMKRILFILKRFWIELTCNHYNKQVRWVDGEGWNITTCNRCHRAFIKTDNEIEQGNMYPKYY